MNVNKQGSFLAAAQQEKMREREALESGLMFSRDRLVEMIMVGTGYVMCVDVYCIVSLFRKLKCSQVLAKHFKSSFLWGGV